MKKRGLGKKAVLEVSYQWILVVIIGAVIILLAISFSTKQGRIAKAEVSAMFRSNIDAIFATIKTADGLFFSLDLPSDVELYYNCETNIFSVSNQPKRAPPNLVIFSARTIEKKMYVWSLDWEMPFSAASFFYVTSPYHLYAFVGGDKYMAKLPDKMTKKGYATIYNVDIEPGKYRWVRLVSFEPSFDSAQFSNKFWSYNNVDAVHFDMSNNKVTYYYKEGSTFKNASFDFIDNEGIIFGAIFSDKDGYECAINRAKLALSEVAKVYKSKIEGKDYCYFPDGSSEAYRNAFNRLDGITRHLSLLDINKFATKLKGYNEDLKKYSCMTIY